MPARTRLPRTQIVCAVLNADLALGVYAAEDDGDGDGEGGEGDGGDDSQAGLNGKPSKARKRQLDVDGSATLASADALRVKQAARTFDTDPLYCRTSKLFDENSASGRWLAC